MGADVFEIESVGKNASEAFNNAREESLYYFGHVGYTGTIAEKSSYIMIDCPNGTAQCDYIDQLLDNDDKRISDKWGPAGCIYLGTTDKGLKRYVFFGLASC